MGLWKLLTKEIKLGSTELQFNEPQLGRARLRGDLIWRLATVLGAWAAGIGVMGLLFSINQDPPGFGVAVGLGAVFGLGMAAQALFFMKDQVAGAFAFYPDHIYRYRNYSWFVALRREQTRWDYAAIENCRIATSSKTGLPFHVMMFSYGGDRESILIPRKVDLKKLTGLLARHGVQVAATTKIPSGARKPLPVAAPIVAGAAGVVLLVAGLIAFPWAPAPAGIERPDLAQLPDFDPREQFGIPDPMQQPMPGVGQNNAPGGAAPSSPPAGAGQAASGDPGPSAFPPAAPSFPSGFPRDGIPTPGSGPTPGGIPPRGPGFGMRPPTPGQGGSQPPGNVNKPGAPTTSGQNASSDVADEDRSQAVGGTGGFPFTHVAGGDRPVVGVRVRTGRWSGEEHLSKVEPLFESSGQDPGWQTALARPGYVVGAVEVHSSKFVDGVRLIYMRTGEDGRLDPADSYASEWIGQPGTSPTRLERMGQPIVGFHGRGGAVLDALGVVYAHAD
ncbi:MAG: jacalin-like lectin [Maioricimonas sp. JB045]